jgi:hypothetical protein
VELLKAMEPNEKKGHMCNSCGNPVTDSDDYVETHGDYMRFSKTLKNAFGLTGRDQKENCISMRCHVCKLYLGYADFVLPESE